MQTQKHTLAHACANTKIGAIYTKKNWDVNSLSN